MNLRIVSALCGLLAWAPLQLPGQAAGSVVPAAKREELLQKADLLLNPKLLQTPEDLKVMSPFVGEQRRVVVPVAQAEPDAPPPPPPPSRLPDAEALAIIAQSFQPTGALISGDRRILNMGSARPVPQGATFNVRIRNESYSVTVADVSADGYTLQLGEAQLRRTFSSAIGDGRITPSP